MESLMTISVIIPTYNREKTIKRCIDSVLNQTYPVSEIIVVDDGSNDNTLQILQKEYGAKIIIIQQSHKGAQAARNAGIIAATGEYIAFLDSDDEWTEKKIELQMHVLQKKPNAVICGNGYIVKKNKKDKLRIKGYSGNVYKILLTYSMAFFPTIITKKENLLAIGLLDENVPSFQEWDTAIRLSKIYEFVFLDKPLFIYHLHDAETISKNYSKDISGYIYICKKYQYEILNQYGTSGLIERYKAIYKRCQKLRDKRYLKYMFIYILGKKGIFLFK